LAGALLRRSALDAARDGAGDVLDRRYFAYQEDVDLGLRLRRAGRPVLYVPTAVARHERGWKPGGRRAVPRGLRRASLRNRLWTVLKNVGPLGILARLPLLLLYEIARASYLLLREPDVLPAYGEAWRGAAESLRRRKSPQTS
jgi:GT2 family glycosyltransferase